MTNRNLTRIYKLWRMGTHSVFSEDFLNIESFFKNLNYKILYAEYFPYPGKPANYAYRFAYDENNNILFLEEKTIKQNKSYFHFTDIFKPVFQKIEDCGSVVFDEYGYITPDFIKFTKCVLSTLKIPLPHGYVSKGLLESDNIFVINMKNQILGLAPIEEKD